MLEIFLISLCKAELMYRLGLRRYPPLEEIVELCSQDTPVGKCGFNYLCINLRLVYPGYSPNNFRHIAFIPAANTSGPCLEKLGDVQTFPFLFSFVLTRALL